MNITKIKFNTDLEQSWLWYYKNIFIWLLILVAILLGVFKYSVYYKKHKDLEANTKFTILLLAITDQDHLSAKMHFNEILKYSDRTPYPRLAGILLAKVLITENNLAEATKLLNVVINRKNVKDEIWHLANLRLAKILLMQKDLVAAEKVINAGLGLKKFNFSYQELNGDLLVANNRLPEAHQSYQQALKNLPEQVIAPWLELKIKETTDIN